MSTAHGEVDPPFKPELTIELRGGVHLVTLDRPASLNAVDTPMHRALGGVRHFLGDHGAAVWPVLTSMVQAKEFLYTGDRIPASEAVRIGLATRTFPDDTLLASALAMGERLAQLPRQALESTKRAVNMHLRRSALEVLDFALAAEAR
jgi:enoyl-CoA hydratase/carnithine racemase